LSLQETSTSFGVVERVESKVDQLDTKLDALSESQTLIRERLASLEGGPQERLWRADRWHLCQGMSIGWLW
jgi:chaperonin cofactor prefoldin